MGVVTTDESYNAESRWIEQKVIIYFPGITPLEVTKDTSLITTSVLEEAHSTSGSSPFGGVTSNELSIELLNENSIFSPTNINSPYYGKMRRGVKIELFVRPITEEEDEFNWDPLGVYYVTEWNSTVTGLVATVTANDKLYSVFSGEINNFIIRRNLSHFDFYRAIFDSLGLSANIDTSLTEVLRYAYVQDKNKELLTALGVGALADCFCKHDGNIRVKHLISDSPLRATITDGDQLIEAKIEQSISAGHDGAEVLYNIPQESEIVNILNMSELKVPIGRNTINDVALTTTPLIKFSYAKITGAQGTRVVAVNATPYKVNYTLENLGKEVTGAVLDLFGTTLVSNQISLGDIGDNLLSINNLYIQNPEYAQKVYLHLKSYINNLLPVLELTIRGNPKFELCDKIQVISEKYNLDYTGLIIKQTFDYDGGLSSTMTLLNMDVLKEVK